jgi:hypothetical protein
MEARQQLEKAGKDAEKYNKQSEFLLSKVKVCIIHFLVHLGHSIDNSIN